MDLKHRPSKVVISGNSGSGKSTFGTAVLLNSPQTYKFVFDWEGELRERIGFAAARDADGLTKQLEQGWVIFDPDEMFPEEMEDSLAEALDWFAGWVFSIKKAINEEAKEKGLPFPTALFYCDEVQEICDTHTMPRGLKTILERGRRQGIDSMIVTQQPNIIHNRVRNQLTEVVAFSQVDENAVTFFEDLGLDGEDIRGLAEGQWRLLNRRTRTFQWGHIEWPKGKIVVEGTKAFARPADKQAA